MKRVVAIACGLNESKKDYNIISKRNLYLNYGLLGLCTLLKNRGYDVKQFQGEYLKPSELIEKINHTEYKLDLINCPIIISIVSYLSLEWCQEITKILKTEYGLTCILGGKYVVDGNVNWLKRKLPYVDLFIEGAGERKLENALINKGIMAKEECKCFDRLDYSLVYDYELYNPSIELARGCGRGCVFCADGNRIRSSVKDADSVINELHFLEKIYNYKDFNLYFQMATFQADNKWIEIYKKRIGEFNKVFSWRCTSRVDTLDITCIPKLSEIGLQVIDLGFESASPRQLLLMKKTNEPLKYLQKAEEILRVAYENGIWIKLNILFSAGESFETITETAQWLDRNRKYIKGISANCETIYGPYNNLMQSIHTLGASFLNDNDLETKGYAHINLSSEIDFDLATKKAKELSKFIMTADDYFDLKKYGYFPRNYTREQFYKDISMSDIDKLPFQIKERK